MRDSAGFRIVEHTLAGAELSVVASVGEISGDYLLGVESDDLDVQYVRRYRLARIAPVG